MFLSIDNIVNRWLVAARPRECDVIDFGVLLEHCPDRRQVFRLERVQDEAVRPVHVVHHAFDRLHIGFTLMQLNPYFTSKRWSAPIYEQTSMSGISP